MASIIKAVTEMRNDQRKSIFVTGAASGISRATALLFAERGWFVGLFDVNEKERFIQPPNSRL
jgi:NAD(P)-dependent dehydrogenase (short-subunit alcohol dehydrogenase family)